MTKEKFNTKLRDYARSLSPRDWEQDLVSKIYTSLKDLLGEKNCLQIGSYPRYTSITPLHDLDILTFIGEWDEKHHDPKEALEALHQKIQKDYDNPTDFKMSVPDPQKHSITLSYKKDDIEFSVDIVPAYIYGKNDFGENTFKVPEVLRIKKHEDRLSTDWNPTVDEGWIISDPNGYIKIATEVGKNEDFRKTVKIIKKWKNNLSDVTNEELKLKSFHLEQVVTKIFQLNPEINVFDAIFNFFYDLPKRLSPPNQIPDRANNNKYLDDYLKEFDENQLEKIKQARDGFLIKLENLKESDVASTLVDVLFYDRSVSEEFIFDQRIPTLTDPAVKFLIDGLVKPLHGFPSGWIRESVVLQKGLTRGSDQKREIEFSIRSGQDISSQFYWKVKNGCDQQPRGEITLNQTKNNPEKTEYVGDHYVECYAVAGGICIAKSKVPVKIIR